MKWLPKIGWINIPVDEAIELGLDQASRYQWQIFRLEWFGRGLGLMVRVAQ